MSNEMPRSDTRPIVFLGPSIPNVDEAKAVLDADYRPPIKRGDLEEVSGGVTVGIIDGVFEQSLAVSPREIHYALKRGIRIYGSSSMGALRAAEVRGVIPIGRVAEWYISEVVTRDDEVALVFDPDSQRPLSEPMVNVRFAVECLVRSGSLHASAGEAIIEAALAIPYPDRVYPNILQRAGVKNEDNLRDLASALKSIDLKRNDAFALLNEIGRLDTQATAPAPSTDASAHKSADGVTDDLDNVVVADTYAATRSVTVWETGSVVDFAALIDFLKLTGRFERYARNVLARHTLTGNALDYDISDIDEDAPQELYEAICLRWGWRTEAEQHVSFDDWGVGLEQLGETVSDEVISRAVVEAASRECDDDFLRAIRAELFLTPLALKLEVTRARALDELARGCSGEELLPDEIRAVKDVLTFRFDAWEFDEVVKRCSRLGVSEQQVSAFVEKVARARRAARRHAEPAEAVANLAEILGSGHAGIRLQSAPKVDARFTTTPEQVDEVCRSLRKLAGITRVGQVGELANIGGIKISQASRPDGKLSSTYGSGKGLTPAAAAVGAIMEETEVWAQERADSVAEFFWATYEELQDQARSAVNPISLSIPFDSTYEPTVPIAWTTAINLLTGKEVILPAAAMHFLREIKNPIYFSKRLAKNTLSTNGLASGFCLEETILHGVCEVIERHAVHLDELHTLRTVEGRGLGARFIDPTSLSGEAGVVAAKLLAVGEVYIKETTSDIRIPTITTNVVCDNSRSLGFACHPNPEVACQMAMLESAQGFAMNSAGGREDLTLRVRSLGRHERTRPMLPADWLPWTHPDRKIVPVSEVEGAAHDDVLDDILWVLERLRSAGVDTVAVVDLTQPGMQSARTVRVVIPNLLSTDVLSFSPRGCIKVLDGLVPQIDRC